MKAPLDDTPNPILRRYATQVGFMMVLTRNQIFALDAIYYNDRKRSAENRNWVTAVRSLEVRGLVAYKHHKPRPPYPGGKPDMTFLVGIGLDEIWVITRAGQLMLQLLIEAGLIIPKPEDVPPREKDYLDLSPPY